MYTESCYNSSQTYLLYKSNPASCSSRKMELDVIWSTLCIQAFVKPFLKEKNNFCETPSKNLLCKRVSPLFFYCFFATRFAISTTMHNTHCSSNIHRMKMHSDQYWRLKGVEMFSSHDENLTTVSERLLIA